MSKLSRADLMNLETYAEKRKDFRAQVIAHKKARQVAIGPNATLSDVDAIKTRYGFSGIPITEDGAPRGKLIGIVTNRDTEFEPDRTRSVSEVMTTDLVTGEAGISLPDANDLLRRSKKGKLPLVDGEGESRELPHVVWRVGDVLAQVRPTVAHQLGASVEMVGCVPTL